MIKLSLSQQDVNLIQDVMGNLPYKRVHPLLNTISEQVLAQRAKPAEKT